MIHIQRIPILDSINKIKLVIFDLDGTIIKEGLMKYKYPDTDKILQMLRDKNIHISLASYNMFPNFFLRKNGIIKYFDCIQGFRGKDKYTHINNILSYYEGLGLVLKPEEILFVDNEMQNIIDAKQKGLKTLFVPHGVKFEELAAAI